MATCKSCGADVTTKFCNKCGTPVDSAPVSEQSIEQTVAESMDKALDIVNAGSAKPKKEPKNIWAEKKKRAVPVKAIAAVGGVIVLVVLAVVGIKFLKGGSAGVQEGVMLKSGKPIAGYVKESPSSGAPEAPAPAPAAPVASQPTPQPQVVTPTPVAKAQAAPKTIGEMSKTKGTLGGKSKGGSAFDAALNALAKGGYSTLKITPSKSGGYKLAGVLYSDEDKARALSIARRYIPEIKDSIFINMGSN